MSKDRSASKLPVLEQLEARVLLTADLTAGEVGLIGEYAVDGVSELYLPGPLLAPGAALAGFLAACGTCRRWLRECKAHGSDEATAKRRASLEAQLATLDAKQEASEAFLAEQGDAI